MPNSYVPAKKELGITHADTPEEDYDFYFEYEPKVLTSDRVQLRPFVPSLHAQPLADILANDPSLLDFWPVHDLTTAEAVCTWMEGHRQDHTFLYHAVYTAPPGPNATKVLVKDYVFAGGIGMTSTSRKDMSAELGWILVAPEFQRTHVLTHTAGLILHRILGSTSDGGLGLRRAQWFTNSLHVKSQAAALRLGFTQEGLLRAHRVLLPGKPAVSEGRQGEDRQGHPSRDSWLASIPWKEWDESVRKHVDGLMAR